MARPRKQPVIAEADASLMSIKQSTEPVVGAEFIISAAAKSNLGANVDDDVQDSMYNPIASENPSVALSDTIPDVVFERVEVPKIRKIAIKKIDRFNFKLGMERSKEKYKLMPGVGHSWAPSKKGGDFLTGLENFPEERSRLEKALRVDLSPTSAYYATLSFRMEDKEHGQIMNFDDAQLGPYYEVVYYAMLASDLVANGLHEFKNGTKPFAEWYIENKEAESEMAQAEMTAEIEATNTFPTLSYAKRMDIAKLIGLPVWGLSDKAASADLWKFIKVNSDNAKAFNQLASVKDTEFNVRVLVTTAIKYNVIRRNRANDYTFGSEVLGPTEDHIVSRLSVATNATLRIAIERQVKAKI